MTVIEKAYAKINLYLEIVGKRPDGYHELVTVMQSISLADTLTVTRRAGEGITLLSEAALPTDRSNLAVRAAEDYFAAAGRSFGVDIRLEKRIPVSAGLGGGSTDAAAVLRALHKLDDQGLDEATLLRVAAGIGADVPFCLVGGTQLCRGIGEKMTALPPMQGALVVAKAGEGVSTPAAFRALDEAFDDFKNPPAADGAERLIAAVRAASLSDVSAALFNRFEAVVEPQRPAVAALKQTLLAEGALAARMSGSGPSVFGLFERLSDAERAAAILTAGGAAAFACTTL